MVATTNLTGALASGFAGAAALTALHETTRRRVPHAPRMDVIGRRALDRITRPKGTRRTSSRRRYYETLAGDLASNTLFYSLVALGRADRVWRRGFLLGIAAGAGAVLLPPLLGLGRSPGARVPVTPAMTVGLYLAGGLAAAAAASAAGRRQRRLRAVRSDPWSADPWAAEAPRDYEGI